MPRLRPDLESLRPYRPGRSAPAVAREFGVDHVVRLGSNEFADPPFPEVVAAITAAATDVNRYPDNARTDLRKALGEHLGVDEGLIWAGGASNELGTLLAIAFGGPGTSILYAWPSFSLYPIATRTAASEAIEIPLDAAHRHDLDAMAAAVRSDTTVIFVCNPNNPSGTYVPIDRLEAFVGGLDPEILVIVDEAYHEFATADDYASAVPLAVARPNVAVTRTFSKAYGLAGLRLGYMVAHPEILDGVRRIQIPFTVTVPAMAGAMEALRYPERIATRTAHVATERERIADGLRERGVDVTPSQANFVYADLGERRDAIVDALLRLGVIIRIVPPDGFVRISVGTTDDTDRFLEAFDRVRSSRGGGFEQPGS